MTEIDNTDRYFNERERELFGELRALVVKKDELDFHYALQTTLKAWLLIHIPATYALLILAVLHLVVVHAFSGGVGDRITATVRLPEQQLSASQPGVGMRLGGRREAVSNWPRWQG